MSANIRHAVGRDGGDKPQSLPAHNVPSRIACSAVSLTADTHSRHLPASDTVAGCMVEPDFSGLASQHTLGDEPIPEIVVEYAGGSPADLVWRNELGGLTFRIDGRFVKWNPRRTGIDLERERVRLEWMSPRHPAPRVIASGSNDEA